MTIKNVIDMISTPEVRELVLSIMALIPNYWHVVPASSSGKYHPTFSLGKGGLVRHSILVAYFARRIALAQGMSEKEQDLMTAAGLLHDGMKQGFDGGHTVHEHPTLMASLIRKNFPESKDAEFLAHVIETHMGKWTTSKYSDVVLTAPQDDYQKCLSAADMVAATKELRMSIRFFGIKSWLVSWSMNLKRFFAKK